MRRLAPLLALLLALPAFPARAFPPDLTRPQLVVTAVGPASVLVHFAERSSWWWEDVVAVRRGELIGVYVEPDPVRSPRVSRPDGWAVVGSAPVAGAVVELGGSGFAAGPGGMASFRPGWHRVYVLTDRGGEVRIPLQTGTAATVTATEPMRIAYDEATLAASGGTATWHRPTLAPGATYTHRLLAARGQGTTTSAGTAATVRSCFVPAGQACRRWWSVSRQPDVAPPYWRSDDAVMRDVGRGVQDARAELVLDGPVLTAELVVRYVEWDTPYRRTA